MVAGSCQGNGVSGAADPALGDAHHIIGKRRSHTNGPGLVDLEGHEVTLVDPDQVGADGQGSRHLGLIVGLAVSLFQALTSVQEQTMSLIPKMFAVMLVTLLLLAPALQLLQDYTIEIMSKLPAFGLS